LSAVEQCATVEERVGAVHAHRSERRAIFEGSANMIGGRRRFCALAGAVALGAVLMNAHGGLPTYRVDVLGTDVQGFGMNEQGDVVGRKLLPGSIGRAFVAPMGGVVTLLPLPSPWVSSDAYAISDAGVIVGAVSTITIATVGSHAAAWFPTAEGYEFALLGALPGHEYSTALGVNAIGDIVGGSGGIGLGLYSSSALFTASGVVELPDISLAVDVNDDRVVVAGNTLLDLKTMTTTIVPLPPGIWQGMVASDITNAGGICGYIAGNSGCSTFPVRALAGGPMEIIGGCATTTAAVSMNDQGDALTFVYNGGVGVVFIEAGYTNISGLIAASEGAWLINGVSTINNARQLLVSGKTGPSFISTVLRLTPIIAGDISGDGAVDGADLAMLLGAWGTVDPDADLDQSGVVDGGDLAMLLGAWTG